MIYPLNDERGRLVKHWTRHLPGLPAQLRKGTTVRYDWAHVSEDLQKRVSEWLAEQGFPLEMKVAAAFREAGFWVTQSDYYEDPLTGLQREIDVTARIQNRIDTALARITFIIECKVTKERPWVLFTAESVLLADRARVVQRTASRLGATFLRELRDSGTVRDLSFFRLPKRPGYGL